MLVIGIERDVNLFIIAMMYATRTACGGDATGVRFVWCKSIVTKADCLKEECAEVWHSLLQLSRKDGESSHCPLLFWPLGLCDMSTGSTGLARRGRHERHRQVSNSFVLYHIIISGQILNITHI